jgi:hypothetical protein
MPRARYVRSAGNGRADDGFEPTARERNPSMARDGYEVLTERSYDEYGLRSESKKLSETKYEPALRGGYNEEC